MHWPYNCWNYTITFFILLGHVQFGYMVRNKFFVSQSQHSLGLSFTSTSLSCSHAHPLPPVLGDHDTCATCVHRYDTHILHYAYAYTWFSLLVILEMVVQHALSSASQTRILIISRSTNKIIFGEVDWCHVFQIILRKDVLTLRA